MALADNRVILASPGTTGTGRKSAMGFPRVPLAAIEIVLEVVGGTPAFTFTIQGLKVGGDPSVATDWEDLSVVRANSATAATATPSVTLATGRYTFYIDGLDKRFFEGIAVNVATNTNVTYRINAYPSS